MCRGNVKAWVANSGPRGGGREHHSCAKPHRPAKNWNLPEMNECERESYDAGKCSSGSLLGRTIGRKTTVCTVANQCLANSPKIDTRGSDRFCAPPTFAQAEIPHHRSLPYYNGHTNKNQHAKKKPEKKRNVRHCNNGRDPAAWANISRAKR